MLKNAVRIKYDLNEYPFTKILERYVFKVSTLSKLHVYFKNYKIRKHCVHKLVYNDNLVLRSLMQNLDQGTVFMKLYHRFIRNIIAPKYGGKISYTNCPKMRVHLANTESVSKWHRDVDITKRPEQINVFLPFTDCFETNTLWCESDYGKGDYQPIPIKNGEAFLFDGGFLSHGTVFNTTSTTRVSLDFRFAYTSENQKVIINEQFRNILSGRANRLALRANS